MVKMKSEMKSIELNESNGRLLVEIEQFLDLSECVQLNR